ncbi:hypothetical protein HPP92_006132 [Vanilla planifolia]|uniref:CDK5RAP1-like protein n=1 Tax=Vanilla planifolia TaxID=51239 RepID=A0A835RP35_VANPL|nr:hypothetical protein HPP92_006132 [Vanilla planifolia]
MSSLLSHRHSAIRINLSLPIRGGILFRPPRHSFSSIPSTRCASQLFLSLRCSSSTQNIILRCICRLSKSRHFLEHKPSPNRCLFSCLALPATAVDSEKLQQDVESTLKVANNRRIYQETYGCQMNVNDMEIVLSIMKKNGYTDIVDSPEHAEIIFINTCAIRDNAEQKVWHRLNYFWFLKREWKTNVATGRSTSVHPPKVVVLGCMAERLKEKILDANKMVDVVCGPDAYRDLPRLLQEIDYGQKGINTLLSLEETYADISPIRISSNSVSAFVSIMRGCNNMCSFCIVPFIRGRERSRPIESILREVGELYDKGVKEVMLLGQNVNSYNDISGVKDIEAESSWELSDGFSSMCKVRSKGLRFSDLMDQLSIEFPEMRFRFTSPHPKDFPMTCFI